MIEGRDAAPVRDQVALGALSRVFLQVSLCGFGGGLALAHRIVVDERQWLAEPEFADIAGFTHQTALIAKPARQPRALVWKLALPLASVKPCSCWSLYNAQ